MYNKSNIFVDKKVTKWYFLDVGSAGYIDFRKRIYKVYNMEKQKITLGSVIATKREQLGISQRELAKATKLNNATIARIEKEPNIVADSATLSRIADKLDIDYNYLLTLNGTIPDNPELRVIARASAKMDEDEKSEMLEFLKKKFKVAFSNTDSDGLD